MLGAPRDASAQAVKPWFLLSVDTSGSMCDQRAAAAVSNSCGFPKTIKMNAAKCAIQNILNQTGDAEFGLEQFDQDADCQGATCDATAASGLMRIAISPTGAASILPLVDGAGAPAGDCDAPNTYWTAGDNTLELCSGGATPLQGSLELARDYFEGAAFGFTAPTKVEDFALGCRPMSVILLTDGMETCGGDATLTADALLNSTYVPNEVRAGACAGAGPNCVLTPIRTYVIGFGIPTGDPDIEAIATAGGTDNSIDGPGNLRGYYAGDEAELSEALARIIFESQLNEVCNGVDDDCDTRVDEDWPAYCDTDGIRSTNPDVPASGAYQAPIVKQNTTVSVLGTVSNLQPFTCSLVGSMCNGLSGTALINCCADTASCCAPVPEDTTPPGGGYAVCAAPEFSNKSQCSPPNRLCTSPGELCDGEDNDCDGSTDEGPLVGTPPAEVCDNGFDDDCDGNTDEGCVGCVPEICDNVDNDCDGILDEDLNRPCGFDLGPSFPDSVCRAGQQTCVKGQWGAVCPGTTMNGPTCSVNVPDSDRELADPFPTNWKNMGGTCVLDSMELCDGLDNDCNTLVDDITPQDCASAANIPLAQLPEGICKAGLEFCDPNEADLWGPCQFEVTPQVEICNGLDDDCDGFTDEAPGSGVNNSLTRPCGTDAGICMRGVETCTAGTFQGCTATTGTTEVCNRVPAAPDQTLYDEDCDTRVDESDPSIPGACVPAGDGSPLPPGPNADRGECALGNIQCIAGDLQCRDYQGPTPELCDNLDSDCDGNNNNGVGPTTGNPNGATGTDPTLGSACFPQSYAGFPEALAGVGACTPGRLVCDTVTQGPVCVNSGLPSAETCDGDDEDCDAAVDEDTFGPTDTCQSTPPHSTPRAFCGECVSASGEVVVCRESLIDDLAGTTTDCTDLGYGAAITHAGVNDCCGMYAFTSSWDFGNLIGPHNGVGECSLGLNRCVNGGTVCDGEVIPVDEICDGLDNDCDGRTDEYIPTAGQPCGNGTGECDPGNLVCTGVGGLVCMGFTTGGNEQCDGLDNDCDGFYDEMNPGGGAQCGGNTQNCKRRMDPANTTQAETEPCGDCDWGVEVCVTQFDNANRPIGGTIQCLGDTGPISEICDGRDNDCDSKCLVSPTGVATCPPDIPDADDKIDEGTLPNVGDACGEDEGECEAGMLVCTGGGLVCQGGEGPTTEVCNGLDDDCDGIIDDGIPVGAPCGTDVGECVPGLLVCDPTLGMPVCQGQIEPTEEQCNNLDDDCDTRVDEGLGLGSACGTDEGLCELGQLTCVNGRTVCSGGVPPGPEVCDCLDNDCDGRTDEDTGSDPVCPEVGGVAAACIMCQCALPCVDRGEFGIQCPTGKAPVTENGECYCVGELCKAGACADETIEVGGQVQCAPDEDLVGSCMCRNNECTFRCSGVVCEEGLVCDPLDGSCKEQTCLLAQFRCEEGQRCTLENDVWQCVDDPCANKECGADEACRDGVCVQSCAKVQCGLGNQCKDGTCVPNLCYQKQCPVGQACNPADGECVVPGECFLGGCSEGQVCDIAGGQCSEDPCVRTRCPYGQSCDSESSQCELRCAETLLYCSDKCVDPMASREHCGATGDCMGDNAGEACAEGLVCSRGSCSDTCADGLVNCAAECIDPNRDQMHCGATGDCMGANDGDECRTGFTCREGDCVPIQPTGGSGGSDEGAEDASRVIASGGGGCTCSVPGAAEEPGKLPGARGQWALWLGLLLAVRLSRRRLRAGLRRAGPALLVGLLAGTAQSVTTGCKVDTFCLDCPDPNAPGGGQEDGGDSPFDEGPQGDGGFMPPLLDGSSVGDGGDLDGQVLRPDGGCTEIEICNGLDDDCDNRTDEDADPAAVNIDINTDVNHCGGCGKACAIEHAINQCVDQVCHIDRSQGNNGCDVGYVDINGDEADGCEYRCAPTPGATDDSACDLRDNDCDNQTDEDVDFATDPDNCGACGLTCRFANAMNGGTCVNEACVLDDTKCDTGFKNLDGVDGNGCERRCEVFPTTAELCNRKDDDCDGKLDEGVGTTDPAVGQTCGSSTGVCETGTTICTAGEVKCDGEVQADTEICNSGVDDDCDGNVDESDPLLASSPACGSSIGACELGVLQCVGGAVVCGGSTFVGPAAVETCNRLDDDCDGLIDEAVVIDDAGTMRALSSGVACSTRSGSLDITPSTAAQGACVYGTLACQSGQLVCRNEVLPVAELCDNVDQDCDGAPVPANLATLTDPLLGDACGNQLGICEPGVYQCTNTGTVGTPNWQIQCSPGSVTPEPAETCDGEDDDCDGRFDENAIGTGANNCHLIDSDNNGVLDTYVAGPRDTGACDSGDTFCTGGQLACIGYVGPKNETCNGVNDDCDANTDEQSAFAGSACNALTGTIGSTNTWNLLGVCTAGTWTCPADPVTAASTGLQCIGGIRPASSESCNNLDDDCDSRVDEMWVATGGQPQPGSSCCPNDPGTPHVDVCNASGAAFASCRPGSNQCAGGQVSCIQTSFSPTAEICDLSSPQLDNDCDGNVDEGFQTSGQYTRIDHCGGCGIDCRAPANQAPNAIMTCDLGSCEIATCTDGYFDDPNNAGADCDLFCPFFAGDIELCDGEDNDCDGQADEAADLQGPVASSFCDQDGACAGAVPICTDIGSGVKGWTCDRVPVSERCTFTMASPGVSTTDEDCDGRVDEGLTLKAGFTPGAQGVGVSKACEGPGQGACQVPGVQICDQTNTARTTCVVSLGNLTEVVENTGARANEVCDGADNDCDGFEDEPCQDAGGLCMPNDAACITANTSGGVLGCVIDGWAQLDADTWVYTHEASRPDANASTAGANNDRSCSVTNRRPWTGISYDDAENACEAAGARLCTRAEWRQACSCGGTGAGTAPYYDYGWPSSGACTTNHTTAEGQCNILDSTGAIDPGGASANCNITHTGTAVYDLSGNVKELTLADTGLNQACDPADFGCRIQVRGGASTNTAVGAACGYGLSFWLDDAPFYNVGFRCCSGPDTRPNYRCRTFNGSPGSASNGGDIVSNLSVSGSTITSITEVRIDLAGIGQNDFDDLDFRLTRGANNLLLVDAGGCNGSITVNYDMAFTDTASGTPSLSGTCTNLQGGAAFDPANAFSVLDGTAADGTWTLSILDDDGSESTTLTSWSLMICGTGP